MIAFSQLSAQSSLHSIKDGQGVPMASPDFLVLHPYQSRGMEHFTIVGGCRLEGEVWAMGSKNATLPLMVAGLLTTKKITLVGVPPLADVATMAQLLTSMGLHIGVENFATDGQLVLDGSGVSQPFAHYDLVRKMRASVVVLGPLVARLGWAKVSLPGGCAIGQRPVDLHVKGLMAMGAEIEISEGYIVARAPKGLKGAEIIFPQVSVGATENLMMAATLAKGQTILKNAALEPEIVNLGEMLKAMGAKISGLGTNTITIDGVAELSGLAKPFEVIPDRLEVGSLLLAGIVTGGKVKVKAAEPKHLTALLNLLQTIGVKVETGDDWVEVTANAPLQPIKVTTAPYPDFPTDLQAQLMAVMTLVKGESVICEMIFDNRFMHVPELNRFGADIRIAGHCAYIRGVQSLKSAPVMSTDLRASMSLVIAALAAKGQSKVQRLYHLDRGYYALDEKLRQLGADIVRGA